MSKRKKQQGRDRKLKKLVREEHPNGNHTRRRVWSASFSTLPRELRDRVYLYLVVSQDGKIDIHRRTHRWDTLDEAERTLQRLRKVNKQIRQEATHTFYAHKYFTAAVPCRRYVNAWYPPLRSSVSRMRIVVVTRCRPHAPPWGPPPSSPPYAVPGPRVKITLRLLRQSPTYDVIWKGNASDKSVFLRGLSRMMGMKSERVGLEVSELQQLIEFVGSARA